MRERARPKVAFFSFTCCEGCQLMVLSCEDEFPEILKQVELVNFREAMDEKGEDYEIAFVEGSISNSKEVKKLKKIREKASVVVALGACSATGGLNRLKNRFPMKEVQQAVYGKKAAGYAVFDTSPVRAIDEVIDVDYFIHGCPISKKEFLGFLSDLLLGKRPVIANYPVCSDCKLAGNECVFERGETCMGPVTRAGCEAVCVTYGCICWGCRGYVDDPNIPAHKETLKKAGLTDADVARSLGLYGRPRK